MTDTELRQRLNSIVNSCPVCQGETGYMISNCVFCPSCRLFEYSMSVDAVTITLGWVTLPHIIGVKGKRLDECQEIKDLLAETIRLYQSEAGEPRRFLALQAEGKLDMTGLCAFADWMGENGFPLIAEAIYARAFS
jgi:hypothetical protein